jgi:WG containing repeat
MVRFKYAIVILLQIALPYLDCRGGDLNKAFKYLTTGDYTNAQKYLWEARHDEPGNVAVDFGLAKFYFARDNKLYNLDSANTYIKLAAAFLPLNPDDKQTKRLLSLGVRDYTISTLHQDINQAGYAWVEKQNTVESYQYYLDNYTDSVLLNRSVAQRNQLAYIRARGKNDPSALDSFIQKYPQAAEVNEAKELFEKLLYAQTTADSSYQSYKKYFDQYPAGTYVDLAKKRYQQKLVEHYNKQHSLEGYVEFTQKYKDNPAYASMEDSIYLIVTRPQSINAYKDFIDKFKDNHNRNDAWEQFYTLYTAEATENIYRKFMDQFPEFPDKDKLNKDLELSKFDLTPVKQGEKFGYIKLPVADSTAFTIQPQYEEAFAFKCGLAAVRSKICTDARCPYYYIDKANNRVFGRDFNYAGNFDSGLAVCGVGDCEVDSCKYGLIDKRGHWAIEPQYDELDEATYGLYLVGKKDKYGFMNRKGDLVISLKYTNAVPFSEGIAGVAIDSNWFFIDTTGKQLFFDYFHDVSSFKDSLCAVTKDGDTWGYIDRSGTFAIPAGYSEANDFENGVAIVSKKEKDPKHKDLIINQRYKIDTTGKVIEKLTAPRESAKKGGQKKKVRR